MDDRTQNSQWRMQYVIVPVIMALIGGAFMLLNTWLGKKENPSNQLSSTKTVEKPPQKPSALSIDIEGGIHQQTDKGTNIGTQIIEQKLEDDKAKVCPC